MGGRSAPLLVAGLCFLGLLLTWFVFFQTDFGLRADERIYLAVVSHRREPLHGFADLVRRLAEPVPFLVLCAGVIALPWREGRRAVAGGILVLLVGANLTTQVLQSATAGDRLVGAIPYAQWPSGHVTAIVSVALGLVLGAPPRARGRVVAIAVVATVLIGWAVVVRQMHLPSDVVGAVLVCGGWAALVAFALERYAAEAAQASS